MCRVAAFPLVIIGLMLFSPTLLPNVDSGSVRSGADVERAGGSYGTTDVWHEWRRSWLIISLSDNDTV